ncbi:unnamed protein product [Closterium sp. Naga37s-1]|nr:unnamed protein product [Closterium sp. Naga37s-1]
MPQSVTSHMSAVQGAGETVRDGSKHPSSEKNAVRRERMGSKSGVGEARRAGEARRWVGCKEVGGMQGGGWDARRWVGRKEVGGTQGGGWDARRWVGRKEVGGTQGGGWDARRWVGRKEVGGTQGGGWDARSTHPHPCGHPGKKVCEKPEDGKQERGRQEQEGEWRALLLPAGCHATAYERGCI